MHHLTYRATRGGPRYLAPGGAVALCLSLLLAMIGPLAGTSHAAGAPALSLSRTSGTPGATLRIKGLHFTATSPVTVSLGSTVLVTGTTLDTGTFIVTTTVPNLPAASYPLSAVDGAGLSSSVTFVVKALPPAHLSLSPHQALPGAVVTISGSHFGAGEPVTVTLATTSTVTATATSSGSFAITLTVPQLAPGTYAVTALGALGGLTATATLHVLAPPIPHLSLHPSSALPLSAVTAKGSNFTAGQAITLSLGSTVLTTTVATANGSFSAPFTVPTLPSGTYTVTAAGPAGAPSASATFKVLAPPPPHLSLSHTVAVPGTTILVKGRHFGTAEIVQLMLASATVATATTTSGGSFSGSFVVPPLTPGTVTFTALGSTSGISVSHSFTIKAPPAPSFGLSRRVAYAGQSIVAQGHNFGTSELVAISIPNGDGSLATVATAITSRSGAFKVTFTVPAAPLGSYLVMAKGATSGITAGFPLRIVAPPTPSLVLWRHSGVAGTVVTARGYHFGPSEVVNITMGGLHIAVATTTAHGVFYTTLAIPALPAGTYAITARGAGSGITATSFFVINPAPYGVVSGLVSDGVSTVAGATVHAVQPDSGRSASTRTDGSGAYSLKLRTGFWRLSAVLRDGLHLRLPPTDVFVGSGAVVHQNLIVPRAPALIEGTVFGPPQTTITVTAHSERDASQVAVTTDGNGRADYTLGATLGLWHINAVLPPSSRGAFDPPHNRAVAITSIGTAAAPAVYNKGTTLTFIPAPYTIAVTVKDSTGAPVTGGVQVVAYSPDFPNGGIGVATDINVNGVYTLHVAGGTWRVNVNRRDGPSPLYQRLIVNQANPNVALTFTLQAAPNTISGVIYNASGLPIADALIDARAPTGEIVRVRSLANGTYLMHVFPGTWRVLAFAPLLGLVGRADVQVAPGVNPVQNFAAPLTFRVGGTVRVGGAPLAFAYLHAYSVNGRNHAETDLNGTYAMLLPIGSYTMRGYAVQTGRLGDTFFTVSGNIADEDWNLPAQGTLRVTVQVNGATINDPTGTAARVSAWNPYTGAWNATSDNTNGVYVLPVLAGIYSVRVTIPGQGQMEQRNVLVQANNTLNLIFNFSAYGTVQGTVADQSGTPIAGAAVFLTHQRIRVRTITDAHGYYALRVQPGLTYRLGAQQPGYVLANGQKITVSRATTQTVNLIMTTSLVPVGGNVLVAGTAGAPAVYAWIWAINGQGGYAQTRSSGFGNWSLRLTPGVWAIRARFDGYNLARPLKITVPQGGRMNGVHLLLTPIPGYQAPLPAATTFDPSVGVGVSTPDNTVEAQVPANAAGGASGTYSIDLQETTAVPDTTNGTPLGGQGVIVTIADAANNPLAALNSSMALNFTYNPAQLPAGVSPTSLVVGYLDTVTGTWQPLPTTVDPASHTVSAATTQLGTFAILLTA